jgi:hypothetical protein
LAGIHEGAIIVLELVSTTLLRGGGEACSLTREKGFLKVFTKARFEVKRFE